MDRCRFGTWNSTHWKTANQNSQNLWLSSLKKWRSNSSACPTSQRHEQFKPTAQTRALSNSNLQPETNHQSWSDQVRRDQWGCVDEFQRPNKSAVTNIDDTWRHCVNCCFALIAALVAFQSSLIDHQGAYWAPIELCRRANQSNETCCRRCRVVCCWVSCRRCYRWCRWRCSMSSMLMTKYRMMVVVDVRCRRCWRRSYIVYASNRTTKTSAEFAQW